MFIFLLQKLKKKKIKFPFPIFLDAHVQRLPAGCAFFYFRAVSTENTSNMCWLLSQGSQYKYYLKGVLPSISGKAVQRLHAVYAFFYLRTVSK